MNLGVAALDQLKNLLLEHHSKYFNDLLSGERSLPFGLLVINDLPENVRSSIRLLLTIMSSIGI